MLPLRLSVTAFLIFTLSGICNAQETQKTDSTKNAIILTSVVLGGALVLFSGYYLVASIKAKNYKIDSIITDLNNQFSSANSAWQSEIYNVAFDGFSIFSKNYQSQNNTKVKNKLRKQFDIAQNAISLIPNQMDTIFYQKAQEADDISSYQKYLKKYPNGAYKNMARKRLQKLNAQSLEKEKQLYLKAKSERTLVSLREYAVQYPEGKKINVIKREIERLEAIEADSLAFIKSIEENSISAYDFYSTNFPSGRYITIVRDSLRIQTDRRSKRESDLYRSAISQNILDDYYAYKNEFPDGEHINEVNKRIVELEEKAAKKQKKLDRINELIYEICTGNSTVKQLEGIINQEKRVGARSGYVDMNVIHKNTKAIIYYEDHLKQLKSDYQSLTKKSFTNNLCTEEGFENNPRNNYYKRFQQGERIERGK